jgi:hypothetical protein
VKAITTLGDLVTQAETLGDDEQAFYKQLAREFRGSPSRHEQLQHAALLLDIINR